MTLASVHDFPSVETVSTLQGCHLLRCARPTDWSMYYCISIYNIFFSTRAHNISYQLSGPCNIQHLGWLITWY